LNNEILNNVRSDNIRTPTRFSQNMVSTPIYSNFIVFLIYYIYIYLYYLLIIIRHFSLELWPSIKCHIHTFILTLFVDDIGFSPKAIISMTLDNIAVTLDENQVVV